MKKFVSLLALCFIFALAACGGSASAAVTNDFVVNTSNQRLFNIDFAQYITQTSPTNYNIVYSPASGNYQSMPDAGGVQFGKLALIPGFSSNWIAVKDYAGNSVYLNLNAVSYALCNGGAVTVGYPTGISPGTNSFVDTGCTAFNAYKAGSTN